jgi:hypothetical protein
MSNYDDQFADGAAQLANDLADCVSYTPVNGAALELSIIIGPEEISERVEQDGLKRRHIRLCSIPRNHRASGGNGYVANVLIHDTFIFQGVGYMVEQILACTDSITRVQAIRLAVHEDTRQQLRRRN